MISSVPLRINPSIEIASPKQINASPCSSRAGSQALPHEKTSRPESRPENHREEELGASEEHHGTDINLAIEWEPT